MGSLRGPELLLVCAALLLLFGAARLPKLAASLGQSWRSFKKAIEEKRDA